MIRNGLLKCASCLTAAGIIGAAMLGPVAANADQRTNNTIADIAIGAVLVGGAIALANGSRDAGCNIRPVYAPACAPVIVAPDRGRRDWDRGRDNRGWRR